MNHHAVLASPFHALSRTDQERARERYLEGGPPPHGVDPEVLRSWQRCLGMGHRPEETFEAVVLERERLNATLAARRNLLQAAGPVLGALSSAVRGSGCGVLLADAQEVTLISHLPVGEPGLALRDAMRVGMVLSERALGTNAMVAAMQARRMVHVLGPEHYFHSTHHLFCSGAPIFDAQGLVAAAIDITAHRALSVTSLNALVEECAETVERRLVEQIPCAIRLRLAYSEEGCRQERGPLLCLDEDGRIVGMNMAARRLLLHTDPSTQTLWFEDLFSTSVARLYDDARRGVLTLNTHHGLVLHARSVGGLRLTHAACRPSPGAATDSRSAGRMPDFGDTALNAAMEKASLAFDRGLPVLLAGETGSGKEVAARALHDNSARKPKAFVALNCAAIPEGLIESELFGHVEGAFTGARKGGTSGKLEQADGGTLFLDEIGDMPLPLQARLLRVLETREVVRLGASQSRQVNFALVCASHQNLREAVQQRRFREDLYYRINGLVVTLPPLRHRDRRDSLIETVCARGHIAWSRLSAPVAEVLLNHDWPGNVRELLNVVRYLSATVPQELQIEFHHLPVALQPIAREHQTPGNPRDAEVIAPEDVKAPPPSMPTPPATLRMVERAVVEHALAACEGRVDLAAQRLGISRATLYRRLAQWRN